MKVLHVLAQLPDRTGSGVYFRNVIDGLAAKGLDQALIYGQQSPFSFDFKNMACYPVTFQSDQVPFPIAGMSDVMPYEHTVYSQMSAEQVQIWQDAFIQQLQTARQEFQPDIIISHHLWYLTALVVDIFQDIPVIGVSHSTDIRQAQRHPHLREAYCQGMERLDLVFSLTPENKSDILATYPISENKIIVIGNGYNPEIFHQPDQTSKKDTSDTANQQINILYAGKIAASKGVFEFVQTYPRLKERFPQVAFHLVGNGDDASYQDLYQLAQTNPDSDFYHRPSVPQKELAGLMRAYDIFVLPSYYEGLATIVLEAMACQMRVVVSDLAPLHQLLEGPINHSGMIEYVTLPRIYDQDQPVQEDLPDYIERLTLALTRQIQAVIDKEPIDHQVYQAIERFAWPQIINRQYHYIQKLVQNT